MKKIILTATSFALMGSLVFTSCSKEDPVEPLVTPDPVTQPVDQQDIVEVAVASGFDSLAVALTESGLLSTFQGDNTGPFTVFAPTNQAFVNLLGALSVGSIAEIDKDLLTTVLQYHVLNGKVTSDLIVDGAFVETLSGYNFKINTTGGVTIDVNTTTKTGINVTQPNVNASNGVIHEIDQVLVPDLPIPAPTQTIAEVAVAAGFDSLVVALTSAGLVSTFDGSTPGVYTVFAPTNQAFVNLLATNAAWNQVSDIDNTTLTAVLTFHVANGVIQASQLEDGQIISTLQTTDLTFNSGSLSGGSSSNVTISGTDNFATNGVIHVIDEVLLP